MATKGRPKGRPKGSKNKPKTPFPVPKGIKVTFDQLNKDAEQEKLKLLVARQDDQIIQMCDEINQLKKEIDALGEEIELFNSRVANYRQIIATLIEVTE